MHHVRKRPRFSNDDLPLDGQNVFDGPSISRSPALYFTLTALAIFFTETFVMLLLPLLPQGTSWVMALVDAAILNVFLFPMLYIFILRPMRIYVARLLTIHRKLETEVADRRQAEKALRESEKELRHLSSRLLDEAERERRRVSAELHEDLGQTLATLKLAMRSIGRSLPRDQLEAKEDFELSQRSIDTAIDQVRHLTRELNPSAVEELGLTWSLQGLLCNLVTDAGIKISLDMINVDHVFSKETKAVVFRVLREVLQNIQQPPGASLSFSVLQQKSGISFLIEYDGMRWEDADTSMYPVAADLDWVSMVGAVRSVGGSLEELKREGGTAVIALSIPAGRASTPTADPEDATAQP